MGPLEVHLILAFSITSTNKALFFLFVCLTGCIARLCPSERDRFSTLLKTEGSFFTEVLQETWQFGECR